MNNKAGLWALNVLISAAIIAIALFGFFMLMNYLGPGDVNEVKATITGINTGSQLINFFRIPANNKIMADLPSDLYLGFTSGAFHENALRYPDLEKALKDFYGRDVNYSIQIGRKVYGKGKLGKNPEEIKLVLPYYNNARTTIEVILKVSP